MKIFYYDHRADGMDPPKPVLLGLKDVVDRFNAEWVRMPCDVKQNSLVFVHSDIGNEGRQDDDWIKLSKEGTIIIFISSDPLDREKSVENIFFCPVPCNSIAATITKMPKRVKLFLDSCDKKRPDFRLLLPTSPSEILYALYLCRLAEIEDEELLEKIIKEADDECKRLNILYNKDIDCNDLKNRDLLRLKKMFIELISGEEDSVIW